MKRNLLMKKLTAALLTGAMVVSMGGMTAFADPTEPEAGEEITTTEPDEGEKEEEETKLTPEDVVLITKKLNKPSEVVLPNVTFNFSVAYADELTGVVKTEIEDDMEKAAVSLKSEDGTANKTTIEKVEADGTGIGSTEHTYTQKIKVVADASKFDTPGTYVYTIKEEDPTPKYEGLGIDTSLNFEVIYGYAPIYEGEGEDRKITGYEKNASILYQGFIDKNGEKALGIFEDDYGVGDEQSGKLNNLLIRKTLSGNQADPSKDFAFTVEITPDNTNNTGKQYSILKAGETIPELLVFENDKATFTLKGGQTATIYGFSASDVYVVSESDYGKSSGTKEGYETSWVIDKKVGDVVKSTGTHSITTGRQSITNNTNAAITDEVTFTNHKNNATPTGIAMTFAPYIAMVAFAGVFAVMFLRKKREDF